jgi:uncharacterized membrane protein YkvA (DUF1232 family)
VNWAGLVVGFGVLMAAWLALWLVTAMAVRLLPPSSVRTAVSFLPATVTFSYRLLRHPLVPRRPRFVLLLGFLYAVSPVTIIPDFVPIIGKLDNVLALVVALRWSSKMIPARVLFDTWPGQISQLRLLVGSHVINAGMNQPPDTGVPAK